MPQRVTQIDELSDTIDRRLHIEETQVSESHDEKMELIVR